MSWVGVYGGSASPSCTINADCEQLRDLSGQLRLAANLADQMASTVASGLNLGDLVLAGALDPGGGFAFEAAVVRVLSGPFGLEGIERELGHLGRSVLVAAGDYLSVDQLTRRSFGMVEAGWLLPGALAAAGDDALHGNWTGAAQVLVTDDTPLIDAVAAELGPVTGALSIAGQFTDGRAVARRVGPVPGSAPPRDLTQVLAALARLDDTRAPGKGEIDIQTLSGADQAGRPVRKVIVYVPGTDEWVGGNADNVVADLLNVRGRSSTYEKGVLQAMRAAGVRSTDDVMIVGHSLGGMVAVNAARDAVESGEFNVTQVVTAGSPIATIAATAPASTQVLAIENSGDVVPATDGAANPDLPNVTTVTVHHNQQTIEANHSLDKSYVRGAADIDASDQAPIRAYLADADGFFTLTTATTERFSIERG